MVDINAMLNWKYKLRHSKRTFGYICKAIADFNDVFSIPALIFLILKLVSSAFSLYATIYGVMNTSNDFLQSLIPEFVTCSIFGFLSVLLVLTATELPIIQVRDFCFSRILADSRLIFFALC